MDRRERSSGAVEAMLAVLQGWQTDIYTALPGFVVDTGGGPFNPEKQTTSVQPSVQHRMLLEDGSTQWVTLPVLLDCLVYFPHGGGVSLTFPIKVGDECLVVFASRCIDAWWQSGGIQVQPELRMHSLSDGFCFAGFSSVPRVIGGISTEAAQLRSASGNTVIELHPGDTFVNVRTTGSATVHANEVLNLEGETVNINGTLIINGQPYLAHTHRDVKEGTDDTGGVNA